MSAKNGGPAFPVPRPDMAINGQTIEETQGMTLRDYFAAKAMQGLMSSQKLDWREPPSSFASDAYAVADAMLAERAKGGE